MCATVTGFARRAQMKTRIQSTHFSMLTSYVLALHLQNEERRRARAAVAARRSRRAAQYGGNPELNAQETTGEANSQRRGPLQAFRRRADGTKKDCTIM